MGCLFHLVEVLFEPLIDGVYRRLGRRYPRAATIAAVCFVLLIIVVGWLNWPR